MLDEVSLDFTVKNLCLYIIKNILVNRHRNDNYY